MEPLPDWLVAMAEAAGKAAFTDEFTGSVKEGKSLKARVLKPGKLICYRYGANSSSRSKRAVPVMWRT